DGTTITLNNNSRLDYPRHFEGPTRTVHLEGEALFKVSKDSQHPFVVLTQTMTTTVHGTTFDVKAYPSQPATVALIEGSVEVKPVGNSLSQLIKPGQRAEVSAQGMTVSQVNTDEETAWSEGLFYYDNRRLEDVANDLGRWYHLPVVFKDSALKDLRLNFAIQRHQPATETIDMLNSLNRFKATLENNQIVIGL
ncbi:MAG: FecR domain-containing protein, partial [Prevotella sp.]|nr:FecR domain-containing protein [Prevotella sp.]